MIVATIFDWADQQPDKAALEYNDEVWSYRAFAEAIARARGALASSGVGGPGVAAVPIAHLRDWWIASLALRSLGLTTVAVQSASVIAELHVADLRAVVTSPSERWPDLEGVCARLGVALFAPDLAAGPRLAPNRAGVEGGHILQTSGTTGGYKKVLIDPAFEPAYMRRRHAANLIRRESVVNVFEFGPWTGVGYKSPAGTWFAGGTVVFSQGRPLRVALRRHGLTHSTMVPGMLEVLLAEPADAYPLSDTMRLGVTGGTITQTQIDQAKARITPFLANGLGATESNPIAITRLDTPDDHRWHTPCVGRIEIVDENDQPVPTGEIGRLRIDTDNAPNGYIGDDEATRAFFKDGYFYPGDLAIGRADGRIALMGRVTDVINVRGHKLAPQPIEDRLREALGVSGVCLVSMQDAAGEEGLHAVIETRAATIDGAALAGALRQEIDGFAGVAVHFVPRLPRNEAGKLLRHKVVEQLAALATG